MGVRDETPTATRVVLPAYVTRPFEVYVNGVPQAEGVDYRDAGDELHFDRELRKEGRLGVWKWTRMLIGIAGVYGKNDAIDVVYEAGGQKVVEHLRPEPVED